MQELGFTEKEAQIYVLLTREKTFCAKDSVTLNIDRRTVYDINSLFHKGYISRKYKERNIFCNKSRIHS